jgi:hypothetical protein
MSEASKPAEPPPNEPEPKSERTVAVENKGVSKAPDVPCEPDKKLNFLYKILDDNQGVIRLLDAKAAFGVALLSAMMGKILADLPSYFPFLVQPWWRKVLFVSFWSLALTGGLVVFKVIFPVHNPADNVRLTARECKPPFFLSGLNPKRWLRFLFRSPRFSMLALPQEVFLGDVKNATFDSLIECMTGEVLKVSYIRQIKADRLRALGYLLFACSLLFVVLVMAQSLSPKIAGPDKVQIEGVVEIRQNGKEASSSTPATPDKSPESATKSVSPSANAPKPIAPNN